MTGQGFSTLSFHSRLTLGANTTDHKRRWSVPRQPKQRDHGILSVCLMRWADLAIIAAYLAGITWFGAHFRASQRSLRDYFLGGRTVPWWAIALSTVSAETSTITVSGPPPLSFKDNFGFLQLELAYLLARVPVTALLLPAYFR